MAEKSVSEVPRDVRALYQKGNDALLRENYGYAIDLLNQVLEKEPGFFDARKSLRAAQVRKAGSGGGFFKKVLSSAGSSPLVAKGQLALRRNPAEAMQIAEQILNNDPTSSAGHRIIAEAAKALELPRTAVMSFDVLVRNSPRDKSLAIQFGYALADAGEVNRAEQILVELARVLPNDNDIAQALKDLSARRTLDEGGYDTLASGEGSYRDILKNEQEAVSLEQQNRMHKSEDVSERLIREHETRLKTEPNNLKVLRSVAELYAQRKQLDKALEYYERARATEMGASDPSLDAAIAETRVRQFEQQLTGLDPTSADYAAAAAKLNAEKSEFQIADCRRRVEKVPTDLALRFEMGALYFKAGRISEAIQEFQKSRDNPHKRLASMNYLAQCFSSRKMYDLAAKTLEAAIKEKQIFDDEKKDLVYNLGSVLDSMGRKEDAIEQFKLIYEVDIGYRDVAAKVDTYYSSQ